MSISASQTRSLSEFDQYITNEINIIESQQKQQQATLSSYAKGFLDKVFSLAQGSHQDVSSYVVYYQHILAFFADGTHTGLENPKQFIGLCGHREQPEAILLKENGRYVEITFDRNGTTGKLDLANIDDIQIETSQTNEDKNVRGWFSMIKDNNNVKLTADGSALKNLCYETKYFTDKVGNELTL